MSFNRKNEEGVAVDLVDCGFPADVGEGGVTLAIPLVVAIEHVYPGRQYTRKQPISRYISS